MNPNVLTTAFILVLSGLQSAHAADCSSNGLGGQFCINDDGTTSDSMPNGMNGEDTYTSNGKWKSTIKDESGTLYTMSNKGVTMTEPTTDARASSHTTKANNTAVDEPGNQHKRRDDALLGRDWNSPANVSSDGSATSSIPMDDIGSSRWP